MAGHDDVTSADHERETRALGGLIRNFEKLKDLDAGKPNATPAPASDRAAAAYDDDPDGVRRALAERILKLREQLEGDD